MLLVGMQSGAVRRYSLRSLRHEATYNLESRACVSCDNTISHFLNLSAEQAFLQNIYLNCNDTKFSVIDIDGLMTVLDLNSASFHLSDPLHNQQLVTVNRRKDCRGMHWSRDMPDLYVTMEKSRMYVFRNGDPEEPVGTLSSFSCQPLVCSTYFDALLKDDPRNRFSLQAMFMNLATSR